MKFKKLIYKNFFGEYNILVTVSSDGKTPHRDTLISDTLIPDSEIYNSHIWIHDNIVKKNHTDKDFFIFGSTVNDDELKKILGQTIL